MNVGAPGCLGPPSFLVCPADSQGAPILWDPSLPILPLTVLCGLAPQDLSYKDRHWHEACFHCSQCRNSLVDKPFAAKEDQLLCTDCYSNEYSSKCQECKKTIMPGQETHLSHA